MSRPVLLVVAATMLLSTFGAVAWGLMHRLSAPVEFFGTVYTDPDPAPGFELVNHNGEVESLDQHRGHVVLLFFGFTHCPDVCPLTLARLSELVERMGTRGEQVRILLVTVDPERDSPEVLAEYVSRFGPAVTGLTGDAESLDSIRRAYGVYAAPQHAHQGEPMIAHTDAVFGIDPSGLLRVLMRPDGPEHELDADLRSLLRS